MGEREIISLLSVRSSLRWAEILIQSPRASQNKSSAKILSSLGPASLISSVCSYKKNLSPACFSRWLLDSYIMTNEHSVSWGRSNQVSTQGGLWGYANPWRSQWDSLRGGRAPPACMVHFLPGLSAGSGGVRLPHYRWLCEDNGYCDSSHPCSPTRTHLWAPSTTWSI